MLAVLLMSPGRPVSAEVLIDHVWGEDLPAKVRESLWSYLTRLRRTLTAASEAEGGPAEARLVHRSGAYALEIDPDSVDLGKFRRMRDQASALARQGEDERAARLLREADQLWRGEPLAGLPSEWAKRTSGLLEQERLDATLDRVAIEMTLGKEADLARELSELVLRYPFVETLVEQLMTALYRAGRQAEALKAYQQARERLISELGAEPGPALRELQRRILQGDPELAVPGRRRARPDGPNNLPRDIPHFTGRAAELRTLAEAIVASRDTTAVTVVVIDGTPGVGKTTLAIHLAHRLAGQFPDGRFFLSLHGHHKYEEPIDPATGLGTLLRAVGAPPPAMDWTGSEVTKGHLEELAARWREQTANKRILLVLDDAASRDQVIPLLPAAPGCLVLITSSHRPSRPSGSRSLALEMLNPADSTELFARIVGPERANDTEAVEEVVRLCGNMPLAIELAASRLRQHPAWTVADMAGRLARAQNRRLREIRSEELEVAASFELSYRYLSHEQRRAFRQIGCCPGVDFSLHAIAAAAGLAVADTERILDGLLDCYLLDEPAHGRYRCHDLIHEYARELAMREDAEQDRRLFSHRLLDYYLFQADRADRICYPHRHRIAADISHVPAETPGMTTQNDARAWLETERLNLLSAVQYAARNGFTSHAALLPHVVAQFLEQGGYWQEAAAAHGHALDAWRAMGDRRGEAQAHTDLCFSRVRAGHFGEAHDHGEIGLEIFRDLGDKRGEAEALDRLGLVLWQGARFREALTFFAQSLAIHRAIGNPYGEAEVLGHAGIGNFHIGQYREALANFERALTLYRDLGDQVGQAKTLNNIGDLEQRMGAHRDALAHFQQVLPIAREIGGRQAEAVLLNNIGNACRHTGRCEEALSYLREALEIYHDIGDRRCEADALNNIGTTYLRMRRTDEALANHQEALEIARSMGEDYEAAHALRSLGDVYCETRRCDVALAHYREALDLASRIGDPYEQASALTGMGDALVRTKDEPAARSCWHRALTLFERLGVPEAGAVRARLG